MSARGGNAVRVDSRQVLEVLALLAAEGIVGWLDGGWGVDALLGEQTRRHADVDLAVDAAAVDRLVGRLCAAGYAVLRDELPVAIALRHEDGREVDLHPVALTPDGGGDQQQPGGAPPGTTARRLPAGSTATRCAATTWTPSSAHTWDTRPTRTTAPTCARSPAASAARCRRPTTSRDRTARLAVPRG
jgi:lincosamide nucleotidyltransferase A/C/D/E